MADKEVTRGAKEVPKKVKKVVEVQSKDKPPAVPKGKRAVWHDVFTYTNAKGTEITTRGHWEVIAIVEKKPKAEKKPKVEEKEEEEEE